MPTIAPFPTDTALVAIAIAYRNTSYIANDVLPRIHVGDEKFKYLDFSIAEAFTLPDTRVGRKSPPNEVEFSATEETDKTDDYGLDDPIPQKDIDNAPANYDPIGRAVEGIAEYLAIGRELRTANLVFNAANYPAGNKVTLSGTSQWNDFANSDPIGDILTGMDAALMRPNIGIFGQEVWTILRQHPAILKAVHGTSGDTGAAARRAVAELLELEQILVGVSRRNTAKKGQAVVLSRIWAKHCSLIHRNLAADNRGGITFGFTAESGETLAGVKPDSNIGARGGQRVRHVESLKEKIVANQAAFFIENAIA